MSPVSHSLGIAHRPVISLSGVLNKTTVGASTGCMHAETAAWGVPRGGRLTPDQTYRLRLVARPGETTRVTKSTLPTFARRGDLWATQLDDSGARRLFP